MPEIDVDINEDIEPEDKIKSKDTEEDLKIKNMSITPDIEE